MSVSGYSFAKEGFFDFNPNPKTNSDISTNIQTLQQESTNLNNTDSKINSNLNNLTNNISNYNNQRAYMQMDNPGNPTKYNTVTIPDRTDMIHTTYDVRKEDINTLLLQQNYIYILGSVTCATLLIAAIMIGRSKE